MIGIETHSVCCVYYDRESEPVPFAEYVPVTGRCHALTFPMGQSFYYIRMQCSRKATAGNFCGQHAKAVAA